MFDTGRYTITQCWSAPDLDDGNLHMVDYVDRYGNMLFRCGWWYNIVSGTQAWTSGDVPTCPDCLEWFLVYLLQEQLPFPNGYDEWGRWSHIPSIGKPLPDWRNLLSCPRLTALMDQIERCPTAETD